MNHPEISEADFLKLNAMRRDAGRSEMTRHQAEVHVTAAPSGGDWLMYLALLDPVTSTPAPVNHDLGKVNMDVSGKVKE